MQLVKINYGTSLRVGFGTGANPVESTCHLKLAADQGIGQAQYNHVLVLYEGLGVSVNPSEFARSMKLAADQGFALLH